MVRWNVSILKIALAVGAFSALLIGSGAGMRWW
jgi:hypothetical protein